MNKILRNRTAILVFLLPALAIYSFTVFIPILWSLFYSFYSWDGISGMSFIGAQNYVKMLTRDDTFWDAFYNNIIYVLIIVSMQVFLGLLVALMVTKIGKGRNLLKTLYFTPAIITSVGISQLFQNFYSYEPMGLINFILTKLGLGFWAKAWLSDLDIVLTAVSVPEGWRFIGLYMIILYSALISIPKEIMEAAEMDGAKGWRLFGSITFPLIKPVFIVTLVMATTGALKGFDIPFLLTNGGPVHRSELLSTYMYKTAFSSLDYGYGSAIAVFIVIESLLAVFLIRKLIRVDDQNGGY